MYVICVMCVCLLLCMLFSVRGSMVGSVRGSVRGSMVESVRGSVRGSMVGSVRGSVRRSMVGSVCMYVCMYVFYVRMYVCMYVIYVCMYVLYVCLLCMLYMVCMLCMLCMLFSVRGDKRVAGAGRYEGMISGASRSYDTHCGPCVRRKRCRWEENCVPFGWEHGVCCFGAYPTVCKR